MVSRFVEPDCGGIRLLVRAQHLVAEYAVLGLDRGEAVVDLLPSVEVGNAVADKRNGARHSAPFRGGVPCCERTGFRRSAQRRRRLRVYSSPADERLTD